MIEVYQFSARSDNFGVLIHVPETGQTIAIDSPEREAVEAALANKNWQLSHILVTHNHWDHIDGIAGLKEKYGCQVTGPEKSAADTGLYDVTVSGGDSFDCAGLQIEVIDTPGHTDDHISYWMPQEKIVFTGDLIFSLGCGKVSRGGNVDDLWTSIQRIRALPDETALYCGHEYTLNNAKFAVSVEPNNTELGRVAEQIQAKRDAGEPTLPSSIGFEKRYNPFLRADSAELTAGAGLPGGTPVAEVFAALRKMKDTFKAT
ncbi:hydroxyacylglutathione hydrolase [Roseovarius sp. 2305UL8-3]|uniref:hydroxyacylglutathione hydrolase n=1 Tax=Roseovarius conchicola TaxID=3121636 RepID=UPI003528CD38